MFFTQINKVLWVYPFFEVIRGDPVLFVRRFGSSGRCARVNWVAPVGEPVFAPPPERRAPYMRCFSELSAPFR